MLWPVSPPFSLPEQAEPKASAMSETPTCPRCNQPFVPLTTHDRRALALANSFPWVCRACLAVSDGSGALIALESALAQERSHYLAVIQTFRTVETRKTLLKICEGLRALFAPGSEVRYAWANVAPELLRELWAVMEKVGGIVPPRPQALMDKPSVSEPYIQEVLEAINAIMLWCEAKGPEAAKSETSADSPATEEEKQYVTLDQAAARVERAKRTLEKLIKRKKNPLPDPDIQGSGGKASEWDWDKLRPWLEQEYGRVLPRRLPSRRS
jgi:hypothetical protein